MHRTDLIAMIAEQEGFTKQDVANVIKAYESIIAKALVDGDKVTLTGFLTLEVVDVPAREGHNPATGEPLSIPARKRVKTKAGKSLKDAVNK